ncbi:MAG TPA: CBS domain-containing protein, partial [Alicyclobacillus sp.]|nr:CBS domain-containing protein [Alicyclobacillus sp.]
SSLFVVGRDARLAGLVSADDAFAAAEKGETRLEAIVSRDFERVDPETPVEKLLPILAAGRTPVAVTDLEGRLKGIVVRGAVLEALAAKGGGNRAQDSAGALG